MNTKFEAKFKNNLTGFHPTAKNIFLTNEETSNFDYAVYVVVKNIEEKKDIFNIRINYEIPGTFFRDIIFYDSFLVVAIESYIYFFDLQTKEQKQYKLNGFFDKFHIADNYLIIATNTHLSCYNEKGQNVWTSDKLAVDKITITKNTSNLIQGKGNWDDKLGLVEFSISLLNPTCVIY